ncbi:acyltransferase family protein [Murimonas intestini]|uniref:Acyltransferase-like protein n=1 Tax=Murimonas intestini TaxID=1337051 RepID=A0AB73T8P6_9FIRM|nr:acyltransferase family protein [Murimonas intestini]MCR1839492.1 acyltransferase [Murimonas intestini]MCR1867965.1 acyltransferase [Murimonas intestini]MCR1882397.1 acyltransferase [Murimonas intestini]
MLLVLFLSFLVFWKITIVNPPSLSMNEVLDYDSCSIIKGILAIVVMSGHISKRLGILFFLDKAGVLAVGIFFFLSGYGLMKKYSEKKLTVSNFLFRRYLLILIPCSVAYILIVLLNMILQTGKYTSLKNVLGVGISQFINWYILVILFLYTVFFISFKIIKNNRNRILFTCIITFLFMLLGYFLHINRVYWGGAFCFSLGMAFKEYAPMIMKITKKFYWYILLAVLLILCVSCIIFFSLNQYSFIGDFVSRNIATLMSAILCYLFLYKIKPKNFLNLITAKLSYEIYIVHVSMLDLFQFSWLKIDSSIFYICAVILSSLFLAYVIHNICIVIFKKIGFK